MFHTESTECTESLRRYISRRPRRLSQTMLLILTQRRKVSQSFCARLHATKICPYVLLSNTKFCVIPCVIIFDIRTKEHTAPRHFAPLRETKICSYVLLSKTKFCVIPCILCASNNLCVCPKYVLLSKKICVHHPERPTLPPPPRKPPPYPPSKS